MKEILRDPAFLGFCTAFFAGAWGVLKIYFMYKIKLINHQAKKDSEIEELKKNTAVMIAQELKKAVSAINPVLEKHSKLIEALQTSVANMSAIYSNTNDMMAQLKSVHENFESKFATAAKGASEMLSRLKSLETEIVKINDDLILVKGKK